MRTFYIKYFLFISFFLAFDQNVFSQAEDASRYFPIAIGNEWQWYSRVDGSYWKHKITKDSTDNIGNHFIFHDSSSSPVYNMDAHDNLSEFYTHNDLIFKHQLRAVEGDSFYTFNGLYKVKVHQSTASWFGHLTSIKQFDWYTGSDTWYGSYVFAMDFGLLEVRLDWVPPLSSVVTGCSIDSINYGSFVRVANFNKDIPYSITLMQNYPNPFNATTRIDFQISRESNIYLKIFDCLGNEIQTLFSEIKKEGTYTVKFDASKLSSGIYFYQMLADNFISTKKMLLLK
jgi:hypothetical protein